MNRTRILALAAAGTIAAGTLGVVGLAQAAPRTPLPDTSGTTASTQLTQDLRFMREEERMARDLYAALAAEHDGTRPFSMITRAENQHWTAVGVVLTRYGIDDPSAGLAAGDYAFDELDTLYADLFAQGKDSLDGALAAGVSVEKADIADLTEVIARTTAADAKQLFENLLAGSQNHLAAFSGEVTPGAGRGMQGRGPGAQNRDPQGQQNQQGGPSMQGRGGPGRGLQQGAGTQDCPLR